VYRTPDALGGGGHLDVSHAKLGERIDNRIDHDAERRGRSAFAGRPDPERVSGGRDFAELGVEKGQSVGTRQRVIQQRTGKRATQLVGQIIAA